MSESRLRSVALGKFDGVHRGHQAVLEAAGSSSGHVVAVVLYPHPLHVLAPARAPKALTTFAERERLLLRYGASEVVRMPFTPELSRLTPEAFCSAMLRDKLGAERVFVGEGFAFGHGARGHFSDLVRLGADLGFSPTEVGKVRVDGAAVSTTRIRQLLSDGELAAAQRLLGHAFGLRGTVVHGDGRGSGLGIPTANIAVPAEKQLPKLGVYAVWATLPEGGPVAAVANIGQRPTVGDERATVEVHVLDGAPQLYGKEMEISFVAYLRGQQKFSGLDALVAQIHKDVAEGRRLLRIESDKRM